MLDRILEAIGRFSYRRRVLIAVLGALLFITVGILQLFAGISYSYADYNEVVEVFPQDDTLVIVYENRDEAAVCGLLKTLSEDPHVTSVQAYATTLGAEMSPAELARTAGIGETFVKTLFYIREAGTETGAVPVSDLIAFLTSEDLLNNPLFADRIDPETRDQLLQVRAIAEGVRSGTAYDAAGLAEIFGIDEKRIGLIFLMGGGASEMTVPEFLEAAVALAERSGGAASEEQLAQLRLLQGLVGLLQADRAMTPAELAAAFPMESDLLSEGTVKLLYLMREASEADLSDRRMTLYDFFGFLTGTVLRDPAFASLFDEAAAAQLEEAQRTIEDGKAQLMGPEHSRAILTLDYPLESPEIYAFYGDLEAELKGHLAGAYYLIGNSAMSNELSKTFRQEYLLISLITAAAIFLVVFLTFRRFSVPLLLVCIIECAVFITMSVMTIGDVSMYFLALIIVQCILMGAMVDYGILLTNYYIEVRAEYPVEEALPELLKRAIRAIAISAIILITITFACGFFIRGAVASILVTICIGAISALLLVVFLLPSLLAIFDRQILKKRRKPQKKTETGP